MGKDIIGIRDDYIQKQFVLEPIKLKSLFLVVVKTNDIDKSTVKPLKKPMLHFALFIFCVE
jgi:hypothetical protein